MSMPIVFQRRKLRRPGLTLMEVMLAIAIFGLALVAIGELIRIGSVSAAAARDLTEAQRLCNNVMAEVGAGIIPPDSTSETPVEGSEDWLYTLESRPLEEQEGMLWVSVTVQQDSAKYIRPAKFTLVRWMTDPAAIEAAKAEAAAAAEASSATTSGSSSGATTSGGATGGSAPASSGSGGSSSTKTGGSSGS
ncbi:MAG: type II secretion system GspH family protein [Planctomycetales bacterium]|nr:type II secretion system GspH family protein [Planctomycetales bacterium]